MILIERMVLLLLENAPDNRMRGQHLYQVCSVLNKRYGLQMDRSLGKFDLVLTRMHAYLDQTPRGFCLNDGGRAELPRLHQEQYAFCATIGGVCQNIFHGVLTEVRARVVVA